MRCTSLQRSRPRRGRRSAWPLNGSGVSKGSGGRKPSPRLSPSSPRAIGAARVRVQPCALPAGCCNDSPPRRRRMTPRIRRLPPSPPLSGQRRRWPRPKRCSRAWPMRPTPTRAYWNRPKSGYSRCGRRRASTACAVVELPALLASLTGAACRAGNGQRANRGFGGRNRGGRPRLSERRRRPVASPESRRCEAGAGRFAGTASLTTRQGTVHGGSGTCGRGRVGAGRGGYRAVPDRDQSGPGTGATWSHRLGRRALPTDARAQGRAVRQFRRANTRVRRGRFRDRRRDRGCGGRPVGAGRGAGAGARRHPQPAGRGARFGPSSGREASGTRPGGDFVDQLDTRARREEIARMLAGETITEAARAAADDLLAAPA